MLQNRVNLLLQIRLDCYKLHLNEWNFTFWKGDFFYLTFCNKFPTKM
nr:MAG TPA: hypothetical protein [Herelleviridae sp.]